MNIAILGFGLQGKSALDYWASDENQITICDSNMDLAIPDGAKAKLGEDYLKNLDKFDLIVRSPSVHPDEVKLNNPGIDKKITSVTNEFFRVCPTRNIIGVTGTKGKGTTSTLITKILQASGKKVHLGGNIGTPPLDMLKNKIGPDDWIVLELANFQLIDIKHSPHIALCLMIAREHQDWHKDFDEYIEAKKQLFKWQSEGDIAIYHAKDSNSLEIVNASGGIKLPYFAPPGAYVSDNKIIIDEKTICKINEIKLLGKHNWQNVCAAVTAVWQVTQNTQAIHSVIAEFSGMEYRLELIRDLNGVGYYNDSFGTTPETAIVAIEAFDQPKVLILGGSDKGVGFEDLASTISKANIRDIILIGKTGSKIEQSLRDKNVSAPYQYYKNLPMPEIVKLAKDKALPGDVVLLSTACASFDMFKNYKDRGDQFNQAVLSLV